MTVQVINLYTSETMDFDDNTSPKHAAAYAFCSQVGILSWLLMHIHDNTIENAFRYLPMIEGEKTWSCGDWAALKVSDGQEVVS